MINMASAKFKIWFMGKSIEDKLKKHFKVEIDEDRQFIYIK